MTIGVFTVEIVRRWGHWIVPAVFILTGSTSSTKSVS
jgi:hypothetical protein